VVRKGTTHFVLFWLAFLLRIPKHDFCSSLTQLLCAFYRWIMSNSHGGGIYMGYQHRDARLPESITMQEHTFTRHRFIALLWARQGLLWHR